MCNVRTREPPLKGGSTWLGEMALAGACAGPSLQLHFSEKYVELIRCGDSVLMLSRVCYSAAARTAASTKKTHRRAKPGGSVHMEIEDDDF